jgi:DNA polymerase I
VFEPAAENFYTALMMKFPTNKVYRPQFGIPRELDGGPWQYTAYSREMWGQVSYPKVRRTVKSKDTSIPTYEVLPYVASIDENGNLVPGYEKPKTVKVKPEDVPAAPAEQAETEVIEEAPRTKKIMMSPAGFPERYMGENAFVKCHWAEFNPKSRPQIIRRLLEAGWVPDEFTDSGNPVTDDPQLTKMDEEFPGTKTLATYLMVQKRLGQISQGEKAWAKLCAPNGFIYPRHHMNATVTFRGAHSDPNISQVPSVRKHKDTQEPLRGEPGKWGYDCRQCFTVPDGFVQVGVDLSGIELRMWAHYQWPYDNGKLAYQILNEDIHENNRVLLGLADRRKAKEWLFAMIYGAGPEQLGFIIAPTASIADQIELGHKTRARFMHGVDGFDMLLEQLRMDARRGYCRALDGRRVPVRKAHAALNSLLQSAGTGILSKYWMMLALTEIENKHGLKWGYDKDFVLMIYSHDEVQMAVREQYTEIVKNAWLNAAPAAGKLLKVRLPIAAEAHIGSNWAECH